MNFSKPTTITFTQHVNSATHRFVKGFPENDLQTELLEMAHEKVVNKSNFEIALMVKPIISVYEEIKSHEEDYLCPKIELHDDVFQVSAYCEVCEIDLKKNYKTAYNEHIIRASHVGKTYNAFGTTKKEFDDDLLELLLARMNLFIKSLFFWIFSQKNISFSVDIPLYKVDHPMFKAFFKKHSQRNIPSRVTLNKKVDNKYESCLQKIRDTIDTDNIYISFDETTVGELIIAGLVVGSLVNPSLGPYLVHLESIARGTRVNIIKFVENGLKTLYPNGQFCL